MAKRTIVECDECKNAEGVDSLTFSFNGKDYELDLCSDCKKSKESTLEGLLKNATVVSGSGKTAKATPVVEARRRGRPRKSTSVKVGPDPAAVRAWATSQGMEVPKRGRLPKDIMVKFAEAGN